MKVSGWFHLCLAAAVVGLGLAGCEYGNYGGNESGDVYLSCKVDGQSVDIRGQRRAMAYYQQSDDQTVVQTGGPNEYRFLLIIPGKETGSWRLGDGNLSLSVNSTDSPSSPYMAASEYVSKGATLQVRVTSYGSVGGYVEGTFAGIAVNGGTGDKMTVSNGKFRAERIGNVN